MSATKSSARRARRSRTTARAAPGSMGRRRNGGSPETSATPAERSARIWRAWSMRVAPNHRMPPPLPARLSGGRKAPQDVTLNRPAAGSIQWIRTKGGQDHEEATGSRADRAGGAPRGRAAREGQRQGRRRPDRRGRGHRRRAHPRRPRAAAGGGSPGRLRAPAATGRVSACAGHRHAPACGLHPAGNRLHAAAGRLRAGTGRVSARAGDRPRASSRRLPGPAAGLHRAGHDKAHWKDKHGHGHGNGHGRHDG